jgi:antitoxin ParD1/3/4
MPMRTIHLTAEQDAFVEEAVRTGKYEDASDAMRDAVRGLQQRMQADELKLEILRAQLQAGIDALDRGEFTEFSDDDLDAGFDDLAASAAR